MKTTYRSFGRGVAVRYDRAKDLYQVLCKGHVVGSWSIQKVAYDYAESILSNPHNALNGGE